MYESHSNLAILLTSKMNEAIEKPVILPTLGFFSTSESKGGGGGEGRGKGSLLITP